MAEYQRHPLARPHNVGQDFWAAGYAGPSLWDRQKYIDPRTGQVWESLEEALRFLAGPTDYQQWDELGRLPDDPNVEAVMPDIRAGIPPGPPFEATFRASQVVPTILPERRITAPDVVTGLLEAPDTGVTISESTYDYDQAQREAALQRAIRREEIDPPYDREAELRDAIRREEIKPPPVQVANIPVNPPIRLENVVNIPPQHTPKPTNLKPFMSPLLSEPYTQTGIGTSTTLPGGKIVNGNLILDEAGWDEWLEQEERRALDRALDFDNLDEQVQKGFPKTPQIPEEESNASAQIATIEENIINTASDVTPVSPIVNTEFEDKFGKILSDLGISGKNKDILFGVNQLREIVFLPGGRKNVSPSNAAYAVSEPTFRAGLLGPYDVKGGEIVTEGGKPKMRSYAASRIAAADLPPELTGPEVALGVSMPTGLTNMDIFGFIGVDKLNVAGWDKNVTITYADNLLTTDAAKKKIQQVKKFIEYQKANDPNWIENNPKWVDENGNLTPLAEGSWGRFFGGSMAVDVLKGISQRIEEGQTASDVRQRTAAEQLAASVYPTTIHEVGMHYVMEFYENNKKFLADLKFYNPTSGKLESVEDALYHDKDGNAVSEDERRLREHKLAYSIDPRVGRRERHSQGPSSPEERDYWNAVFNALDGRTGELIQWVLDNPNDGLETWGAVLQELAPQESVSPSPQGFTSPGYVGGLTNTTPDKSDTPTARKLKGQEAKDARKRKTVSAPSFSTEVHDLYDALSDAEHRSDKHRKDRWIKSDVKNSNAWGPVQMMPRTLEEARRVGSLSSGIPLTAEEESYVDSFLKGHRYVGKKDKELYVSIAKKLLHYYSNKYKDPLKIANVWRWGERGSAPKSKSFGKGRYGLGKDISSPVGDPGSDLAYWEEFKRMMGL